MDWPMVVCARISHAVPFTAKKAKLTTMELSTLCCYLFNSDAALTPVTIECKQLVQTLLKSNKGLQCLALVIICPRCWRYRARSTSALARN